ncbi:putative S-adenosylmethionine:2-demethylmenaquinone methyltransferase [Trichinella spiralis]|uniref:putative S-adenosylmethionine:2-demethylmenaquinone methyltransferase n=1 Tax=Trichinella spiralis TaxID=6334 RepID=UPI0001EFE406|nr:putative S-adenosylmethionine:2-demethylmenaquinone methyltransferase [Trichinella spiralis]
MKRRRYYCSRETYYEIYFLGQSIENFGLGNNPCTVTVGQKNYTVHMLTRQVLYGKLEYETNFLYTDGCTVDEWSTWWDVCESFRCLLQTLENNNNNRGFQMGTVVNK